MNIFLQDFNKFKIELQTVPPAPIIKIVVSLFKKFNIFKYKINPIPSVLPPNNFPSDCFLIVLTVLDDRLRFVNS